MSVQRIPQKMTVVDLNGCEAPAVWGPDDRGDYYFEPVPGSGYVLRGPADQVMEWLGRGGFELATAREDHLRELVKEGRRPVAVGDRQLA